MNKLAIIIILFITLTAILYPQEFKSDVSKKGTTSAPFLTISQSARATSMGSAFVGISDDPSALFWNPAGLAKLEGVQVMFDHTIWLADIKYNFLAASYNLGDLGTVGISFTASDIGEMKVTTIEQPNGTGQTFSATDVAFSIAYAIRLTENFSIGFNPKFINQSIWDMNANAFAIDMGVQYVTPFDGMILAMSVSNFGTKMTMTGNSNLVLHDLDPTSTGNNDKIPAYLETENWSLPLNFKVGVAYVPFSSEQHKLIVALDANHPSDNYESINLGGEYTYNNFVSIRGGYKSLFLQEAEESFTVGFGVTQRLLGNVELVVDYAYQDFGRLSDIQKFTLSIKF